jgi:HEAT repeats/AhpC/TSA family
MLRSLVRTLLMLTFALLLAGSVSADDKAGSTAAAEQAARNTLARFDKGDPGWKVRMESLVRVVKVGPGAVPVLVEALKNRSPSIREFAAQVLAILADPGTRPALERALTDPEAGVRIYAIKALSMSGKLVFTEPQREQLKKAYHDCYWIHEYIGNVVRRDDTPNPAAVQRALTEYDLTTLDRARLGQAAPDFALVDGQGQTYRLSQFRGRKLVILEFTTGDG